MLKRLTIIIRGKLVKWKELWRNHYIATRQKKLRCNDNFLGISYYCTIAIVILFVILLNLVVSQKDYYN